MSHQAGRSRRLACGHPVLARGSRRRVWRCSEVPTTHEWLVAITNGTVLIIDAMVLVIMAIGTNQAFVKNLRVMLMPSATGHQRRNVSLQYACWLVAGLTFQLARRYPCDLNRSELGRTVAPRDRRRDSNFAQLLPRERSVRGSQTAIRTCGLQVHFRIMRGWSGSPLLGRQLQRRELQYVTLQGSS